MDEVAQFHGPERSRYSMARSMADSSTSVRAGNCRVNSVMTHINDLPLELLLEIFHQGNEQEPLLYSEDEVPKLQRIKHPFMEAVELTCKFWYLAAKSSETPSFWCTRLFLELLWEDKVTKGSSGQTVTFHYESRFMQDLAKYHSALL